MIYKGTILKIKETEAIIMTENSDFITIKKLPGMHLGQKIEIGESYVVKNKKTNYYIYSAVACIALFIILGSMFLANFPGSQIFAFIDVDINPSLEFAVDSHGKVLEVKPLNKDAEVVLTGLKLKSKRIQEALAIILEKSREHGFLDSTRKNTILIAAALSQKGGSFNNNQNNKESFVSMVTILKNDVEKLEGTNVEAKVFLVSQEERKKAVENNLSMGKYYIFEAAKEEGKEITVEELQNNSVTEVIEMENIDINSMELTNIEAYQDEQNNGADQNLDEQNTNGASDENSDTGNTIDNSADDTGNGTQDSTDEQSQIDSESDEQNQSDIQNSSDEQNGNENPEQDSTDARVDSSEIQNLDEAPDNGDTITDSDTATDDGTITNPDAAPDDGTAPSDDNSTTTGTESSPDPTNDPTPSDTPTNASP